MAFDSLSCPILLLPPEQVRNLCSYLTPDAVCQLEKTCSQLQNTMDQEAIWKKQVESFPVAGIPFGDSSEATYSKLRRRWDYFNWRLLKYFYREIEPERFGWDNPYRVALRTKFTIDKLLRDIQNFGGNDLDEALGKLKEEAILNPDRDELYKYPLKTWQVTVELDHSNDWDFECWDYLNKWMVHGSIIPGGIDCLLFNEKNVFKIECWVYHIELMRDESESENENDSSDDENHDTDDGEEEEDIGSFDDNSDTDEEEEGAEDLE